ncbi:isochorismatase family cysteine hydrolase [Roseisalinus antarcticus]|uniref:Peroxyureidoacrylate/ureidoacrylate amidohydrolase RutB n=1 Tax=Roseisalinus antarcticus TaxID=254357 RepID=A0A1Y5RD68_9RHOB|nr:isochorismatase family cysteine hydrolase [Roseisalinus antarcticus]SLN14758.1 Peroxyureidoacrylate/ureidoacrylate amidohydrolase RutB [Roseisalinus antarcticus]
MPNDLSETAHLRRDRWSQDGDSVSLVRPERRQRPAPLRALPQALTLDLSRTALMVIDMQNDFLHPDGWFAADRGADVAPLLTLVPAINTLCAWARAARVPVIHVNWGIRADAANLPANVLDKASACGTQRAYGDDGPNGPVLVEGGWGADSLDTIETAPGDLHVSKHRLSGFRDNALDQILRRLDVTTLIYTGVNLDRCVFATMADGCFQGFDAVIVEDACGTPSPPHVTDAILYITRMLYGFTTTTDALARAFSSPQPKET